MTIEEFVRELHFLVSVLKKDYQPNDDYGEGHFEAQRNAWQRIDTLLDMFAKEHNILYVTPATKEAAQVIVDIEEAEGIESSDAVIAVANAEERE